MSKNYLFTRILPATFIAGALFGTAITSIGATLRGSAIFRDVSSDNFADEAIGRLYEKGIIKGIDSTHYSPDAPVTRAQVAVLLDRLLQGGYTVSSSSSSSRSSVSSSSSSSSISSSSSSSVSSSSSYSSSSLPTCTSNCVHFQSKEYYIDNNDAIGTLNLIVARLGGAKAPGGGADLTCNTGTAVPDRDYKTLVTKVTFAGSQTSQKIPFQIVRNSPGGVHVICTLTNKTGEIVLDNPNTTIVHIRNPNAPQSSSSAATPVTPTAATTVTLSALEYAVMENGSMVTITVQRKGVTTGVTEVNYTTSDGSARSGVDYTGTNGKFTFAAGETSKSFPIAIVDNSSVDGNHYFTVSLSGPTNGAELTIGSAKVTTNDNEAATAGSGSIKFANSTVSVTRSVGTAKITVNHVGGIQPVSVSYATSNGSGVSGLDYTATSGTLPFALGEVSKTFEVPIINRTAGAEMTVNLTLSSPIGAPLSDPSTATLKISQ